MGRDVAKKSASVAGRVSQKAADISIRVAESIVRRVGPSAGFGHQLNAGGQSRTEAAQEIAAASLVAAVEIYASMEEAARTVIASSGQATADLVSHRLAGLLCFVAARFVPGLDWQISWSKHGLKHNIINEPMASWLFRSLHWCYGALCSQGFAAQTAVVRKLMPEHRWLRYGPDAGEVSLHAAEATTHAATAALRLRTVGIRSIAKRIAKHTSVEFARAAVRPQQQPQRPPQPQARAQVPAATPAPAGPLSPFATAPASILPLDPPPSLAAASSGPSSPFALAQVCCLLTCWA